MQGCALTAKDRAVTQDVGDEAKALGVGWASSEAWGYVPDEDGVYPPHRNVCFGCGPENETGLGIKIRDGGDGTLVCTYRFPERFMGGPGLVHGGAIAAVMDDVLGTVTLANRNPAVTGRLTIDYRRPVVCGHEVTVRAWEESTEGRKITVKGTMEDSLGRILVEATGLMIVVLAGHFQSVATDLPPEEIPDDFKPFLPGENYP